MANIKIEELDAENSAFDLNVARGRFESALHDLRNKEETSTSEEESDTDAKTKTLLNPIKHAVSKDSAHISNRPTRKRRRKDVEIRESGFHQTYVMRMFDRSVDLAQFEESAPLYPICRAWMQNYPNNEQSIKTEPSSPSRNEESKADSNDRASSVSLINDFPSPDPWLETHRKDCRIPSPIPHPSGKLTCINAMDNSSNAKLLQDHVVRWQNIRNKWKDVGLEADERYSKTHYILKTMFER